MWLVQKDGLRVYPKNCHLRAHVTFHVRAPPRIRGFQYEFDMGWEGMLSRVGGMLLVQKDALRLCPKNCHLRGSCHKSQYIHNILYT